jgi:hypothetical protein
MFSAKFPHSRRSAGPVRRVAAAAALALAVVALASAARAGEPVPGRYAFHSAGGQLLRLDTATGEIAVCVASGDTVSCRLTADERARLEARLRELERSAAAAQDEAGRLRLEKAEMERRLAARPADPPATRGLLPDEKEMNRAFELFENFMRRMMRALKDEPRGERI